MTRTDRSARTYALTACLAIAATVIAGCGGANGNNSNSSAGSQGSISTQVSTPSSSADVTDNGTTSGDAEEEALSVDQLKGRELVVATWGGAWGDYEEEYMYKPFEAETGVKVTIVPTTAFDTALMAQQDNNAVTWDLLTASTQNNNLEIEGRLQPFPKWLIDSTKDSLAPGSFLPDESQAYQLDYGATTFPVVCNPSMVAKCPRTIAEFFDVDKFPGSRLYNVGVPTGSLSHALTADGIAPQDMYPLDIDRAIAKLRSISDSITVWSSSPTQDQQLIQDKEVAMGIVASGRAFIIKRDSIPDLEIGWEGALVAYEGWAVPKGAPNADVAFAFLKWFADNAEAQAAWTNKLSYMTPTKHLRDLVTPEVLGVLPIDQPGTHKENGLEAARNAKEAGKAIQQLMAEL